MKKEVIQKEIDNIWDKEWKKQKVATLRMIFGHRLFVEGYPIFKRYIPKGDKLILDIGGGSGRYSLKLAQDFSGSKVVVTDISEGSLVLIKKLSRELKLDNVGVKKEDILNLSFSNDHFDVVFCDGVIQHILDYEVAVSEMIRVLKPGGIIIVSAVNYWNPHTFYKFLLKIIGKKYRYGYEKSFKKTELRRLFLDSKLKIEAVFSHYFEFTI